MIQKILKLIIPTLYLLGFLLFIILKFPDINPYSTPLDSLSDLSKAYELNQHNNISVPVSQLEDTGYNYMVDGKAEGRFYYTFHEKKSYFFLLKNQIDTSYVDPNNKDNKISGQIELLSPKYETFIKQFAKDLDWDKNDLETISSSYLLIESSPYSIGFLSIGGILIFLAIYSIILIIKTLFFTKNIRPLHS